MEFVLQGWSLVPEPSTLSYADWLAIGRHHGLPTRLLDWTDSPLVALYFAIDSDDDKDGCIWKVTPTDRMALTELGGDAGDDAAWGDAVNDRLAKSPLVRLDPLAMHPRFRAQQGLFTASSLPPGRDNYIPLNKQLNGLTEMERIVVPSAAKPKLRRDIDRLGVDYFMLFPDLDGLGQRINRRLRDPNRD